MHCVPRGWFALALAAYCGWSQLPPARAAGGTLILVDSLADPGDPTDALTTLREALLAARVAGGDRTISFDPALAGGTLRPVAPLPSLAAANITLDGDLDDDGNPDIELDGTLAGPTPGLLIESGGNLVTGLIINRFAQSAIVIRGATAVGSEVRNCYLGTNRFGLEASPNSEGVRITEGAERNTIGPGNIISGNTLYGVLISGIDTRLNVVRGNKIGTDANGTAAVPNDGPGVKVTEGAGGNTIGPGNTISGNNAQGLVLSNGAHGTEVVGNQIGTDVLGQAALPNHWEGVALQGRAYDNQIGGLDANGNLISGNNSNGIVIRGAASGTTIAGNRIGTGLAGATTIGNGDSGIAIEGFSTDNTIGPGNLISGNAGFGIVLNGKNVMRNAILGNSVGVDGEGNKALPNGGSGIALTAGASENTVGPGNLVSGNFSAGVVLENGAHANMVIGNLVGTDIGGKLPIPNGRSGILIQYGAPNNAIGGIGDQANTCSGNREDGIVIVDAGSDHNVISGNACGTDRTGEVPLPNGADGIAVGDGASGNLIGPGNRVAWNKGHGVRVADAGSLRNVISSNSIWGSVRLGIWLADGGNAMQAPPLIVSASTTKVSGRVAAGDGSVVEIFRDAYNEGGAHLGSAVVSGSRFDLFGNGFDDGFITATVTDADGNTSTLHRFGDGPGRKLIGITSPAGALYDVDIHGQTALRGETGVAFVRGCLAHRPGGELFLMGGGGSLYRIDATSAAATWMGNTGYPEVEACAFGSDGRLYVAASLEVDGESESPGTLVRVHPETLKMATIGRMRVDIDALAFVDDGRLIGIDTHVTPRNEVYSISLTTGVVTLLAVIPDYNIIALANDGPSLVALDSTGALLEIDTEQWTADTITVESADLQAIVPAVPPRLTFGDFNGNGVTDAADYGFFRLCHALSGPGVPALAACPSTIDWEDDGDVDLRDFAMMQTAFGQE